MLCVKVMTLKFDEVRSGYDDAALNDFLRKHRAVDVKKLDLARLFKDDPVSYWRGKETFVRSVLRRAAQTP